MIRNQAYFFNEEACLHGHELRKDLIEKNMEIGEDEKIYAR